MSGLDSVAKANRWVFVALLVVTAVVVSTAIRVEILNSKMGGYLPRPQPPSIEGNEIPWRLSSLRMIEESYRRSLLAERGIEISDAAMTALQLNAAEQKELNRMKQRNATSAKLKHLLEGLGSWQYVFVPLGILLSITLLRRHREKPISICAGFCMGLLIIAGIFMLYRQYYPAIAA